MSANYWLLDLNFHDYLDSDADDEAGPFFHAAYGPYDTYEAAQDDGNRTLQFFAVVTYADPGLELSYPYG